MAVSDSAQQQSKPASAPISGIALLVASAFFMEFLDGTVIATALPDMARSFGVSAVDLNIAFLHIAFLPAVDAARTQGNARRGIGIVAV